MRITATIPAGFMAAALLATPVVAQDMPVAEDPEVTVYGETPVEGPDIEGVITARRGDQMQVTAADGTVSTIGLSDETTIRASGGFLGLNRKALGPEQLLNGLPVRVATMQAGAELYASDIRLKTDDLETASMIRNATAQRFAEQRADIDTNTAAAEALRGRMGEIDNYDIKGTTNVYFDTGEWTLSGAAQSDLCLAASQADTMDNSLLLVVGYTDSVGGEDYNQVLSERRAGRVVNYLQQACGWKPWRMLTPTGFAEADPAADNTTAEGRRQNRRVAVNILVSKATEEGG